MLTYIPSSLRTSWRAAIGIALILVAVMALAAACSSDPTPTSPPPPRATPTPTPMPTATPPPTPVPTATPTPVPATAMPAPATSEPVAMGPSDDFVITETTTGGDIIALFSETEAACVRDTLGDEALVMLRDTPLMEISDAAPPIPFECLTPENVGNIGVAMIALQAGGLTPESRSCAKEVVIANPIVLTFQEPGPDTDLSALMAAGFQLQACFTPEEVAALNSIDGGSEAPSQEAEPLSPEVMQCMQEKLGSLDDLMAIFSGAEPDPKVLESMFSAALECGLELPPMGGG